MTSACLLAPRTQRQEAEYIIIGTFMSFGYGLLVGFLTKYFLEF